MSTIFDSAVYQMRQNTPFASPKPMEFMKRYAEWFADNGVRLEVEKRHSVASRLWWTLSWEQDGRSFSVSAQEWDLCFWRAIQAHKVHERARDLERQQPMERGGFFKSINGYEDGAGI